MSIRKPEKKEKKKEKPRKLSKVLTEAIVSGRAWTETVEIIEALEPVSRLVGEQIEALKKLQDAFDSLGGTLERGEMEGGSYFIRFALRQARWTKVFDSEGRERQDVKEDRSGSKDPEAMEQIALAMKASLEIPRREFVLSELERLKEYLENANVMDGIEKMKRIFEKDPAVLFEAASSIAPEAMSTDVDMSPVVESR